MDDELYTDKDLNVFTFPIDDDKLNEWCPYGKDYINRTDCAINALKFIDIIEDEIGYNLAQLKNETKIGTTVPELVYLMHKTYRNYNFFLKKIKYPHTYLTNLPKSTGVISIFTRVNDIGHLQIISKDMYNNFYIIDTQSQEIINIRTPSRFNKYMKNNNYSEIYVLVTEEISDSQMYIDDNKKRPLKETNIQIRKPDTISPPLKRRKINTSSHSPIDDLPTSEVVPDSYKIPYSRSGLRLPSRNSKLQRTRSKNFKSKIIRGTRRNNAMTL